MRFENPQLLWLLLVFPPALTLFFWWAWRKNQRLASMFIDARLLPGLVAGFSSTRRKLRLASIVLAVASLILALARPQWGFTWEEVKQRGLDIVVAIDTSKSMLAQDIAPNRLARAKLAALDLTAAAKTDRLGLVAFAGSAFLQCPLTIDDAAFRQSVESLDVTSISDGGTALADAIRSALTAFNEGDNHKILVMLTDGEDHDSDAVAAAKAAAQQDLQIFTIGIGTPEGELLRIRNAAGEADYIRDEQGNVVKSRLNEDLLRQIAGATQRGFYLPLRGANTIDTLYKEGLAPLPKSESNEKFVKRYHERFHWPLSLAILLLAGEMFFPERKRRRPAPLPMLRPAQALLVAACLGLPASSYASPSSALRDYKSGNYQDALKEYEELLERKPDDPRLHFNAGTAAYRAGDFEEAIKQFEKALNAQDLALQQQAYYNRGNTLYHLGENTLDPKAKMDAWQKSINDFQSSLKLNAQDSDAQFNQEFVKRKLEEFKQQQQQQQQQDQNQQEKEDQQQNPQNQPSQQQDQKQQSQPENQQGQQQQEQQQPQQQAQNQPQQQPGDEKKQEQQSAQQEGDKKEQQAAQAKEEPEEPDKEEKEAVAAGQMTPEQARQLLDAEKGDEKVLPIPQNPRSDSSRPKRDW